MPDALPFSQHYQVRVTSTSRSDATDDSDNRVWMGKGVDFNLPNSSVALHQGDYIMIEYSWAGNGNIDFDLYKGGKLLKQLEHGRGSGYYVRPCWCWGSIGYTGTDTPAGDDYAVVATPVGEPTRATTSPRFTIGTGGITIVSPKGGEIWHPGDTQTVQWTWTADHFNVGNEISLKLDNSGLGVPIARSTNIGAGGSGSYTFTVPKDTPPGTNYQVVAATYGPHRIGGSSQGTIAVGDYHSVKIQITGNGYVLSSDYAINCWNSCSYFYNTGKSITLQPMSPNFGGWSGGTCSGTGKCTFVITGDMNILATFNSQDVAMSVIGSAPAPIRAGTSAQFQVSLASSPGFTSPASLSCAGLPAAASCTFDKNGINLSTSPTIVTVTLHTTGAGGASAQNRVPQLLWQLSVTAAFGMFGIVIYTKRARVGVVLIILTLMVSLVSCGGGGGGSSPSPGGGGGTVTTPPGAYQITVTANAGSISRNVVVPVTIQ
jgi:hypothetical protein